MTIEQDESFQEACSEIRRIIERNPFYNGDIKLQCKAGIIQLVDWRMMKPVNVKVKVKTM